MSNDSKTAPPSAADIRAAREKAGLTQVEAAAIVHSTGRVWRYWESGAYPIPPAMWELFQLKIAQHAGGAE